MDSVNNSAVGYSFLDDPHNGFDSFRDSYGYWLLSDPDRVEKFIYCLNGELLWKPDAVFDLLKCLEAVALQDKTSHQHMKDRYIPHAITHPWATELVRHLVMFRPLEELLVGKFIDEDALHVYRTQLWPSLRGTLTSERYGDHCAAMTARYLGRAFKLQLWCSLMTAFSSYLPDSRVFKSNKEYFADMGMMHSSAMRNGRYGRTTEQVLESDFHVTVGCIQACLDFQKHVGIRQERPFTLLNAQESSLALVKETGGWRF